MHRNRFFTADQHFGHANILKYEDEMRRDAHGTRFSSIGKMDDYLVNQWNASVTKNDVVYCLGDFCYMFQQMCDVLPFLNGEKILISGNHDPFFKGLISGDVRLLEDARDLALQAGFSAIHLHHEIVLPEIGTVQLSHFPYAPRNTDGLPDYELRYLEHRPARRAEKLLLHGHVHSKWLTNTYAGFPPMLNIGVDMWEMRPVSEAEIVDKFRGLL